jgi:hypothetical protein
VLDINTFTGMFYATLSGAVGLVVVLVTFTVKVNTLMVRQTIILEELAKTHAKDEARNQDEHKLFSQMIREHEDRLNETENFCKYSHRDKPRID